MPKTIQPIAPVVVTDKGGHKANPVKAPKWLPKSLKPEFKSLVKQLAELQLCNDLDADVLGQYLVIKSEWLRATAELERHLTARSSSGNLDTVAVEKWSVIADRFFKQARKCGEAMGLSVSSRCRLVLPKTGEDAGADYDDLFGDHGANRDLRLA